MVLGEAEALTAAEATKLFYSVLRLTQSLVKVGLLLKTISFFVFIFLNRTDTYL